MICLREFKAQIVHDFERGWIKKIVLENELLGVIKKDLKKLNKRIAGKKVILIEITYENNNKYYFEKQDGKFLIFPELFLELAGKTQFVYEDEND